jgi:site-specific recombinase XerD
MTTALRVFFRFAQQRGDLTTDLAAAVPSVAHWSLAAIPQALTPDQVARVLASCDTQTAIGRRDRAILVLLARYALRGGEVAALTLDDIDWATGRLTIHGKGGRLSQFPLLTDVGTALAAYLQQDRPTGTSCRHVFMRIPAPAGAFKGQGAIGDVVRRALNRAGIAAVHKGSHVLRHSVATQMLRRGAALPEIGELLRHRNPRTTAIYAKVDLTALRTVAAVWPGGAQ